MDGEEDLLELRSFNFSLSEASVALDAPVPDLTCLPVRALDGFLRIDNPEQDGLEESSNLSLFNEDELFLESMLGGDDALLDCPFVKRSLTYEFILCAEAVKLSLLLPPPTVEILSCRLPRIILWTSRMVYMSLISL